jgi:hypothetical protein
MTNFLRYTEFITEASINIVIDKLGTIDSIEIKDMDDYVNHFIDNGAKRLAGGASAEVLEFKGNVIKIFAPINDPGMTRYLSFCLSNKNNPFVPKIEKIIKSFATEEDRWIYAVFMENLKSSGSDFEKDLNAVFYAADDLKFGKSIKDDNEFFNKLKNTIIQFSKGGMEKDIDNILSFLRKGISKFKYGVDFGPQNWMLRGSQLVLIDPFWPDMES